MLSSRGQRLAQLDYAHGEQNRYDAKTNPGGIIMFSTAENAMLFDDLVAFFNRNNTFESSCCSYGEGYTGTLRLRKAMALHLNEYFKPARSLEAEDLTFVAGVTDLNEVCASVLCEGNGSDALLMGRPVYGTFARDMTTRMGIRLVYTAFENSDQFSTECVQYYERALEEARREGINVRGLVICNPHNPLGQCYTREALTALIQWCHEKQIHLISDEIYALSTYQRPQRANETFVSALSIEVAGIDTSQFVHTLYGLSKDYGAGGLRLGCLITHNEQLANAVRAVCRFSSPSQVSMHLAAAFLEDRLFVQSFLAKSHQLLGAQRQLAESLLDAAGIGYHRSGNACLFIWIDLSPFLNYTAAAAPDAAPVRTANKSGAGILLNHTDEALWSENPEGWAAEAALDARLRHSGVRLSTGALYRSPQPGWFRVLIAGGEDVLREGIRRIVGVARGDEPERVYEVKAAS